MRSDAAPRQAGALARTVLLCAILLGGAGGARAAEPDLRLSEHELKAALIYNYTQFIEWPAAAFARPTAPFNICVLGNPAIRSALLPLERRSYRGHPISIQQPSGRDDLSHCHVLYVDAPRHLGAGNSDLAALLGEAPTLTVSSAVDAVDSGYAIGFVTRDDRIRWNMNLNAVRRARLKVSANLIEIAVSVVGESGK